MTMTILSRPSIAIIIVNWNAGDWLRTCLESLRGACADTFTLSDTIVVDNGSTDGSLAAIDALGVPVKLIHNAVNRGFAAACNEGAWSTSSDYLLFLNPDTRLFHDSLSMPLIFMEQPANRHVGICGIKLIDENGNVARHCSRFPTPLTWIARAAGIDRAFPSLKLGQFMADWDHLSSQAVPQVIGAFFLVRRCVFKALGGFDERYFVYFEEADFALRAAKQGWTSFYLAEPTVFHAGGGTSRQVKAERLFYSLRSRLLYAFKHFSAPAAWMVLATTLLLEPITRTIFALLRRAWADVAHTVRGYRMLFGQLPSLLAVARHGRSASASASPGGQAPKAGDSG